MHSAYKKGIKTKLKYHWILGIVMPITSMWYKRDAYSIHYVDQFGKRYKQTYIIVY
jgi:hypothetical protein